VIEWWLVFTGSLVALLAAGHYAMFHEEERTYSLGRVPDDWRPWG